MIYGELTQADIDAIETEHSHRMAGYRAADRYENERNQARKQAAQAREQAAYWRNEYLNAAHELSEIMRVQHRMERHELVTRLASQSSNMVLIAKNAPAEEGDKA